MSKITFTREALDIYKSKCNEAKERGSSTFVWKGSLNNVYDAEILIDKLEKSINLSILV